MGTELIIGILSFLGTAIGTLGGILTANKLTNYRINELEKKVEKHNTIVERTYILEKDMETVKTTMEDQKKEIRDTKKELKEEISETKTMFLNEIESLR